MVLLHGGWGYEIYPFDRQIAALTAEYRVVIPDRSGYGGSPPIDDLPADFHRRAAEETRAVIDALDLARPILWGHSDGAIVALLAGLADPGRIAGAIVEATHLYKKKPASRAFFEAIAANPESLGPRASAIMAGEHGERWRQIVDIHSRAWLRIAAGARPPAEDFYAGRLGDLEIPALVVHGAKDPRTEPGELMRCARHSRARLRLGTAGKRAGNPHAGRDANARSSGVRSVRGSRPQPAQRTCHHGCCDGGGLELHRGRHRSSRRSHPADPPILALPPILAPVFLPLALGPHPQRELTLTLRRGVAWPQRSVAAGAPTARSDDRAPVRSRLPRVRHATWRDLPRVRRHLARRRSGRVRCHSRSKRLRKVDAAQRRRRVAGANIRTCCFGRFRPRRVEPAGYLPVSTGRVAPLEERARQRGTRPDACGCRARRGVRTRRCMAGARRVDDVRSALPFAVERRHAQAGRHGAALDHRSRAALDGRAIQRTRRPHPPADGDGIVVALGGIAPLG